MVKDFNELPIAEDYRKAKKELTSLDMSKASSLDSFELWDFCRGRKYSEDTCHFVEEVMPKLNASDLELIYYVRACGTAFSIGVLKVVRKRYELLNELSSNTQNVQGLVKASEEELLAVAED